VEALKASRGHAKGRKSLEALSDEAVPVDDTLWAMIGGHRNICKCQNTVMTSFL
jgi:hypothetical protein